MPDKITKICSICKQEKLVEEFCRATKNPDGHEYRCRICVAKYVRQHYLKNKQRYKKRQRERYRTEKERCLEMCWKSNLRRCYGITPEQYNIMFVAQEGCCAICNRPEKRTHRGKTTRLSVDHDRKTRKVRALLCSKCNAAIGLFYHNTSLLDQAISYLRKHSK